MPSPAKQVDPRDLFITRNPTGLASDELEKGRSGFVDHRTHGDYLVFLSGYEAAAGLDPSDEGQGQHALIDAEGCKPEISIRPVTSAAAGTAAHDLSQAEGEQPDLNILHVAAPCAAAAVGRCQKAEGGQPCVTEAESNKRAMLAFAATIGEICHALGIDGHSEPDMIVDAAREVTTASKLLRSQIAEREALLEWWKDHLSVHLAILFGTSGHTPEEADQSADDIIRRTERLAPKLSATADTCTPLCDHKLTDVLPTVAVEGDQLVIRITTECLLHAVTCSPEWPMNYTGSPITIDNGPLLIQELIHELQRENEDGTNAMHRLFDSAALDAVNNGSQAVSYDNEVQP